METKKVPLNQETQKCKLLENRVKIRTMSAEEWIEEHASGTLRKNKKIGFSWKSQYRKERITYEFGWGFEVLPKTYVTIGAPITEGDCKPVTEAGWHVERYLQMNIFPEDKFVAKYMHIEYPSGEKKEGIGIVVLETSANWLLNGQIVFAMITEYDLVEEEWKPAENPF